MSSIPRTHTSNGTIDRLPPLRDEPVPSVHHQEPRIHEQQVPAHDRPHLRHGGHPGRDIGVGVGPRREEEPVHHLQPVHDAHRLCDVSRCTRASVQTCPNRSTRCISTDNPKVVYGGVFIAACGLYPALPGIITWMSNNLSGGYKRSVGMGMHIGIGNLGGVSIHPHPPSTGRYLTK